MASFYTGRFFISIFGRTVVFIFARDKLSQDALRKVPRKDAVCEWKMSVGRLRPAGPADITKQTRNFQALKLSIRRSLSLPRTEAALRNS